MKKRALVLAAGKGSRMKDGKPKVLQTIFSKPLLSYVIDSVKEAGFDDVYPILGYKKEEVIERLSLKDYVVQENQLGTADAVNSAKELLSNEDGLTLVIAGDQPLITPESLMELYRYHMKNDNHLTLLTANNPNPFGYGRILSDKDRIIGMVEEIDATDEQRLIKEVNISTYLFDNKMLWKYIDTIDNNNKKKEFYINDLVGIFNREGLRVSGIPSITFEETIGINNKKELMTATKYLQEIINDKHLDNGVLMYDSSSTYIGPDVTIESGTIIYPNTIIEGRTSIGRNCELKSSYIMDSTIGNDVVVGPFAHLRNQAIIGDSCRIGNFVEIKNSKIGRDVKAAHLAYLGDAEVGENTNVGCGAITVNYDGKNKHRTIIGKNVFLGSNANLIAPIVVGDNSLIAAGSTITEDVDEESLAIARTRNTIKSGYYSTDNSLRK